MELIGRRFGHIRVTEVVGQGGMGDVYAGYDETLERKVALKVLNADQRLDDEARDRLLREARALSRLDHPNICRIHDYIESGDVDLLVLEYIDGRTLEAAMSEGISRSEKLRIAAAVAGVLVTAHRAGIVHRDLKPENVMLTRTGEVKVLDFGLARWLNRARSRSSGKQKAIPMRAAGSGDVVERYIDNTMALEPAADRPTPSGRREFLATAVGITLGTPLYMSPEQARGEELTAASDMFAFGLLLQALFTGKDPHPIDITAREVILRVARGETLPVVGAPGDVTALIHRLKQFAPADRPTAVETVERIQILTDKPQRIARRAIVAALVLVAAVGIWRYMVDLRAERAIAVTARAEAEHRRAEVENLVEFMLGDLRKKLEPVGRLEILDDVGKRALDYVESLNPEVMTADELARNAKALNQLGEVRVSQGKTPEALDLFRRSLNLANEAIKKEPNNPQVLLVHGAAHFWLGNGLRLQGKNDEALPHMRAYMNAGDALVGLDARRTEYQLERAYGHSAIALILDAMGDYRQSLEHHKISLSVKEMLAADQADADARAEFARALGKVGAVQYKLGDLPGAGEHARREIAVYRDLLSRDTRQAIWKQRLATSLAYYGRVLYDMGRRDEALRLWREELVIEMELAELDPSNVVWERAVAVTSRWIASALMERGETQAGLRLYRRARTKMDSCIQRAPTRVSLVLDAAIIDSEYAYWIARGGAAREAAAMLQSTIRRLESMPNRDRLVQYNLAYARHLFGEVLRSEDGAAAQMNWQVSLDTLRPIVSETADPTELALWSRVLVRTGRCTEARRVIARLSTFGYATTDLERVCSSEGC